MLYSSTPYAIGINGGRAAQVTYLPGGDWGSGISQNHLRAQCKMFVFLQATADLTNIGGGSEQPVYIPCYFPELLP